MGERESEGSGNYKDQCEIGFHTREEKKNNCNCGSEECDCDSSCPNSRSNKSILDIFRPYTRWEKTVIGICILLIFLSVYFFNLS